MNLDTPRKCTTHHLKTWSPFFHEVFLGRKRFEIHKEDDKVFAKGDLLVLQEWDPATQQYTGRTSSHWVTYLLRGPDFGIEAGTVVLSLGWTNLNDIRKKEYQDACCQD